MAPTAAPTLPAWATRLATPANLRHAPELHAMTGSIVYLVEWDGAQRQVHVLDRDVAGAANWKVETALVRLVADRVLGQSKRVSLWEEDLGPRPVWRRRPSGGVDRWHLETPAGTFIVVKYRATTWAAGRRRPDGIDDYILGETRVRCWRSADRAIRVAEGEAIAAARRLVERGELDADIHALGRALSDVGYAAAWWEGGGRDAK